MLCLDGTLCAESDLMILEMFVGIVFSCTVNSGTACLECRKKSAIFICIV